MKILIAPDFYPVRRVEDKLKQQEFEYLMGDIRPIVEDADYSLVNYESTFHGDGDAVTKFGPSMATDENSVKLAQWCGFKGVTLGNNHIHDYGDKGLLDLLDCLQRNKIDFVGAGMNLEESGKTLYKNIDNKIVAFINCCEHEFNVADKEHGGANPLDVVRQYYAITEAKMKADYVIVIVHGGSIDCQLPSPRMQKTYRFFIDCGASAVVNHHQHCFSGYEYYHDAPIFYGLGNLLFDKPWLKNTTWTDGYMLELSNGSKDNGKLWDFKIYPYLQCADEPRIIMKKGKDRNLFDKKLKELNSIIKNPELLEREFYKWVDSKEDMCKEAMSITTNKYIKALQRRHLLPRVTSDTLNLLNYIYCEAHLDRMLRYLKKKYIVQ